MAEPCFSLFALNPGLNVSPALHRQIIARPPAGQNETNSVHIATTDYGSGFGIGKKHHSETFSHLNIDRLVLIAESDIHTEIHFLVFGDLPAKAAAKAVDRLAGQDTVEVFTIPAGSDKRNYSPAGQELVNSPDSTGQGIEPFNFDTLF